MAMAMFHTSHTSKKPGLLNVCPCLNTRHPCDDQQGKGGRGGDGGGGDAVVVIEVKVTSVGPEPDASEIA